MGTEVYSSSKWPTIFFCQFTSRYPPFPERRGGGLASHSELPFPLLRAESALFYTINLPSGSRLPPLRSLSWPHGKCSPNWPMQISLEGGRSLGTKNHSNILLFIYTFLCITVQPPPVSNPHPQRNFFRNQDFHGALFYPYFCAYLLSVSNTSLMGGRHFLSRHLGSCRQGGGEVYDQW